MSSNGGSAESEHNAQFWARDGGQDYRAETRDRGDTGAREERIPEEHGCRGLVRAGQVHRVQGNPSLISGGRKKVKVRKTGTMSSPHPAAVSILLCDLKLR